MQALYRASQAGVKIDLICRGICALRPGLPGVSDNIHVTSIVDRFLEHSRIYYFGNGGDPLVYIGSADWMDRNLSRRVEVLFPMEAPELKQRLIREILATTMADNVKARELLADGTYRRLPCDPSQPRLRSQERFLEIAAENAAPARGIRADHDPAVGPASVRGAAGAQTADEVRNGGPKRGCHAFAGPVRSGVRSRMPRKHDTPDALTGKPLLQSRPVAEHSGRLFDGLGLKARRGNLLAVGIRRLGLQRPQGRASAATARAFAVADARDVVAADGRPEDSQTERQQDHATHSFLAFPGKQEHRPPRLPLLGGFVNAV